MDTDWIDALEADLAELVGEKEIWHTPADLAQAIDQQYVIRDHLRYLSDRLAQAVRDVEGGQSRYLSVSMPPRLGKSFLTSVFFPLWVLHKHPDWDLMLLSHDPSLAAGWGRQIRRGVENNGATLDLEVAADAGAAKEWEVRRPTGKEDIKNGTVLSRSIRESVTGRGAKVMILDDIVKDFADAHSKSSREFIWDWWTANSRTRLHPPALVVAIGTRWHEDDFIGRLLSHEHEGDPAQWEVISFPALAENPEATDPRTKKPYGPDALGREPGEPLLSPIVEETSDEALERWADIRQAVGTYAWASLFQQRPEPADGAIFNNDWWRYWRPGDLDDLEWDRLITTWDCAFKGTDTSDYVVGQLWGSVGAMRYLLRQVRARLSFTETLPVMRDFITTALEYTGGQAVHEHVVEDKANGTAVLDVLRTEIEGMVPWSPGTDSKEARARAVSPTVEGGNVVLPALADWLPDYLSEMKGFPNAAHDDQVDGTTMALLRLRSAGNVVTLVPQAQIVRGFHRTGPARPGMGGVGRRR